MRILFFFFSCAKKEGSIGPRGGVLDLLLLIIVLLPLFLRYVSVLRAHVRELFSSVGLDAILASCGYGLAARFMSCKD